MANPETNSYDVTALNKVGRMPARAAYDRETVHGIFRACPVAHVAWVDEDGYPQQVPMVAAITEEDDGDFVLLHGYISSRFMKTNAEENVRLCVSATLVDGYVLSLTPFNHSMNYRSAILHGYVDPLPPASTPEGKLAKAKAMEIVTDSVVANRYAVSRAPTSADVASTGIIRLRIESGSAKSRAGGTKEDKKDLDHPTLSKTTWSGHVPLRLVASAPIAAEGVCLNEDFPDGPSKEVQALYERFQ